MELQEFLEVRRPRWGRLEELLNGAEVQGLKRLSWDDARELARLYRGASSDLLWVRARGGSVEIASYVNDLVGRAYALTYPAERLRWADVWRFVAFGFPALLFKERRMFAAAWLLMLAGAGFGYLGVALDPSGASYLVPGEHQQIDPVKRAKEAASGHVAQVQEQAAFASFLFTHNIEVAFLVFALGLTAGVGTAVLLFVNGLMLGALARVYDAEGMTGWFWAWILPHGIPELTAICIAGAGGLLLARAMVTPGTGSRRTAVRHGAGDAVRLLFGTLLLFVLAGLIEGSISQIHPPQLSIAFKLSFAGIVGTGVYAYLFSAPLGAWAQSAPRALISK